MFMRSEADSRSEVEDAGMSHSLRLRRCPPQSQSHRACEKQRRQRLAHGKNMEISRWMEQTPNLNQRLKHSHHVHSSPGCFNYCHSKIILAAGESSIEPLTQQTKNTMSVSSGRYRVTSRHPWLVKKPTQPSTTDLRLLMTSY